MFKGALLCLQASRLCDGTFFYRLSEVTIEKKQSNLGYFYLVINGRPQSPKQKPQYDVLFLLKLYSPKCSSIYIVIY